MRKLKRVFAILLTVAMILSCVPTVPLSAAAETGKTQKILFDDLEDTGLIVDNGETEAQITEEPVPSEVPEEAVPESITPNDSEEQDVEDSTTPAEKSPATKSTATSGTTGSCTWTLDGTVLTITGNGYMQDYNNTGPWGREITEVIIEDGVTTIGKYAFYLCTQLTAVTIPGSVTNIGYKAFYCCTSLVEITIPGSVTVIGGQAFYRCTSLVEITIPGSVTVIGDIAFSKCNKLTAFHVDPNNTAYSNDIRGALLNKDQTVLIQVPCGISGDYSVPASVTAIGSHAFYDCDMLMSITMYGNVTTISDYAFYDCDGLTAFEIGSGVTNVGAYAFYYCRSLTSITIPEGVVRIGNRAFDTCSSLTSISIPASVTEIGEAPFTNCDNLTEILVDSDNASYCSDDKGVLYNKNKTILIQAPERLSGDYNIPQGVTEICDYAFEECRLMTAVTIPDSVTRIGACAFSVCGGLSAVTIPGSSISLEHHAFYSCRNLMTVTIQGCITECGSYVFAYCPNLTSASIGLGTTQIGYGMFYGCSSLQTVAIPNTVTKIIENAFSQSGLETIYYDGDATQWEQINKLSGWDTGCTYTVTYLANFTVFYTTETGHVFPVAYVSDLKVEPGSSFNGADLNLPGMTAQVVSGPAAVREDDNMTVEVDYGATGTIVVALFCKGLRIGTLSFLVENGDGGLFAAGYGTEERPFLIEDATDFSNIRQKTANSTDNYHFMLIASFSLDSMAYIEDFRGTLDGNGFVLRDWTGKHTGQAAFGVFGQNRGTIKNLVLENCKITNNNPSVTGSRDAGLLCGNNMGTLEDIHIVGGSVEFDIGSINDTVFANSAAGLLCGYNSGTISRCEAYGRPGNKAYVKAVAVSKDKQAQVYIGGLVGFSASGSISDCQAYECTIVGQATAWGDDYWFFGWHCKGHGTPEVYAGGVIGYSQTTSIWRVLGYDNDLGSCSASHDGCGCGTTRYLGSIVGYREDNNSTFVDCYSETADGNLVGNNTAYNGNKKSTLIGRDALKSLSGFEDNGWYAIADGYIALASIDGIRVNMPVNSYEQGQPLNLSGTTITAYMEQSADTPPTVIASVRSYSPQKTITRGYTVSGYDADKLGSQTVTFSYGPASWMTTVTVSNHEHTWCSAATCKVGAICEDCGYEDRTQLLPHTYVQTVTKPTCKGGGYTTYTCSVCGHYYIADAVPALEHKLDFLKVCEYCGIQFEVLRDFTVYVCDAESAAPIAGAMVSLGGNKVLTDADGAARYQIGNNDQQRLTIEATGYPKLSNDHFVPGEMPDTYIYLESGDTGIYEAWCNGDNVLLVESQINVRAPSKVAKIVVKGRAKTNILKYEIVQDGMVLASSADGVFQIKNPHFLLGTPVFVRMHTDGQDGHNMFQRELNIAVIGVSFDAKLDDLIPHLGGATFSFDESAPSLFQGVELPLLGELLPENRTFKIKTDNERLIVTYGLEDDLLDKDTEDKSTREIFKELLKKFDEQNNPNFWPKGKKKSEVTATVALIIEFGADGKVTSTYGEIHIGYEFSYSWGKTFVVWIVPIYAGIKFNAGGDLTISEIGYNFEESRIMVPDSELKLYAELSAYGGVGCSLVSAGVYGTAGGEIIMGIKDLVDYFKYRIYGEIGLYARIDPIFWEAIEYKLPLITGEFYGPNGQVKTKRELLTSENYEVASRDYLENRSQWKTASTYAKRGDASGVMQTSVYTAIEPRIVQSGDTVMMLFLDDDGSEGYNYQHLYYSILDTATNSWGVPVRVDDSAFADVEYDVYADETGIYLTYSKIPEITEENRSNHIALLSGVEIYTAQYDGNGFVNHTNVSQNDCYDSQPQITKDAVVWVSNSTNDTLGENANNVLMLAQKTQDGWAVPTALNENGATVTSIDMGLLDGETCVAVVRDADCDLTTDDRLMQLVDMEGTVAYIATADYTSEGVRFETVNGKRVLQWACAGNVWQIASADQTPVALFAETDLGINEEFKYQQLDENSAVILFAKNAMEENKAGSSLYGVYCVDGQWGQAVPVTDHTEGMYVDAFDVCYYKDKLLIAYINTEATIEDENIWRTSNFVSTCVELKNDLIAQEAVFLENALFEGAEMEIVVPITNRSWQKLQNTKVQVQSAAGTVVYEQNVMLEEAIASGESDRVVFTLPKACLTAGEQYSVVVTCTDWSDMDLNNNAVSLELWYADFEVLAKQTLQGDDPYIQYAVTNKGNISGSGNLVIYDDKNEDGTFKDQPKLYEQPVTVEIGKSITGMVSITEKFKDETVYVVLEPTTPEKYQFNNEQSVSIGGIERTTTDDITGEEKAIPSPVFAEPYIIYDRYAGGDISALVTENGWSFTGIEELQSSSYSYSDGILELNSSYLQGLDLGYHYYSLSFSLSGKSAEAMLIVEIRDHAPLSVQNVTVTYDGAPVEITDLSYETPSTGAVSVRYSSDGSNWINGLPTNAGKYTVELSLAAEENGFYTAAQKQFDLTITKALRSISAPQKIERGKDGITFTDAVPEKEPTDGKITYGYSTKCDPYTVTQWSDQGVIPPTSSDTTYYIFARITESGNYEDSYSAAYITTGVDPFVYGDANGDGVVNTKDIILIRRHVAAKDPVTGQSSVEVKEGADANGDGVVNTKDIILVRRHVAAKDPVTGESSVVLGPNK